MLVDRLDDRRQEQQELRVLAGRRAGLQQVRAGIGGTVTLKVLVNTEGTVDSVAVMDGPEMLVDAAMDAARVTTFTPARHLDRPVACWVLLPYRFTPPQ